VFDVDLIECVFVFESGWIELTSDGMVLASRSTSPPCPCHARLLVPLLLTAAVVGFDDV